MSLPFPNFFADCNGNVAVISAFAFLPIIALAGGATDLARYEAYRVQLQDGVDRGVLAAASLTQTRPVETTIRDYMGSIDFIDDVELQFTQSIGLNQRQVSVDARYEMATAFLPLLGINSIGVEATATAIERRGNIEISLALDLSNSMEGNKYTSLKSAATSFVRTMLTSETKSYTSISAVPYAGHVNVGRTIFDGLGGSRAHNESSCFNLNVNDYASGWRNFAGRSQVPHFTVWRHRNAHMGASMNPGWCPGENNAVTYLSNDPDTLASRIAGYQMYDGTGTNVAMNYGLMLLDPSTRPLVQQAATAGLVPPAFANRPADYDDAQTLKVIVLMTDGAITEQYTATDPAKPVREPNNFKYYRDPINNLQEVQAVAKRYLNKICDFAKSKGVMVFTIGFQLSDANSSERTMKNELRACASSASHYYDVTGLDIAGAFQSIATAIHKIRLTH